MIIDFELRNWKSFKDWANLSALSTREKQHGHRRAHIKKINMNILPVLGIFGGNASGKSNLIDALVF